LEHNESQVSGTGEKGGGSVEVSFAKYRVRGKRARGGRKGGGGTYVCGGWGCSHHAEAAEVIEIVYVPETVRQEHGRGTTNTSDGAAPDHPVPPAGVRGQVGKQGALRQHDITAGQYRSDVDNSTKKIPENASTGGI